MSFNSAGLYTINLIVTPLFPYLAYGSGIAVDNATSLTSEDGRLALSYYSYPYNNLTLEYLMSDSINNGNIISEIALANAVTGDVYSPDNTLNIDKNTMVALNYVITFYFKNQTL